MSKMNALLLENRKRNHAIDLLKFLAAILITNSHMVSVYPSGYNSLATGGAIGDSLFFLCSGFLLMGGTMTDFFNWYKRRINRIFPTIFAIAIISMVVFNSDPTFKKVLLDGGGWFVQAIFVFYAIFWFIKRYLSEKLWIAYVLVIAVIIIWFSLYWNKSVFFLADGTYLRWPCFFLMMLLGATLYKLDRTNNKKAKSLWLWLLLLVVSIIIYYGVQLLCANTTLFNQFQILLLPVLMIIAISFYNVCSHPQIIGIYTIKYLYWPIYYISACCLEIYLSGSWTFPIGKELIGLFPMNIIICFILIFCIAYLVKVFSNFLSQTFDKEEYNWGKMVRL